MKAIYIYKGNRFCIKISPYFFVVLAFALLTYNLTKFLIAFFSILLHELGHISAALCFGKRVYELFVLPVGLNASIEENRLTVLQKVFIYLSGPIINIILTVLGLLLKIIPPGSYGIADFFIQTNIYLAVFNLIPGLPLDGAKILREAIAGRIGLFAAHRYIKVITLVLFSVIIVLGLAQFFLSWNNISLLMAGLYLFSCHKPEGSEAAMMNVKNIIYRRTRLEKKGIYPARDLVVMKSLHLVEVLKNMDFDRFHIIYVLDENMRVIKLFSEQEIIDAMLKHDSDMTFEKLIETQRIS